jgi:hypothetical protein
MRRALAIGIGLALAAGLAGAARARPDQRVLLNGKEVRLAQPVLRWGEVLLIWVRDLERFGLGTLQPSPAGEVRLSKGLVEIGFKAGSDRAAVNGLAKQMPAPAMVVEGRMMVPVEFVCQAFGVSLRVGRVVLLTQPGRGASQWVRLGTIGGRVTYAGAPAEGVRVRLVRASDNGFVPGAAAVTSADGRYLFTHVPNGDYHAFVYAGDNPEFFNRRSAMVGVTMPASAQAEEIRLGRILRPARPLPGGMVKARGGKVRLSWMACPGAAGYRIAIKRASDGASLFSTTSAEASCEVPAEKLNVGERVVWSVVATGAAGEFLGGSPGAGGTPWAFTLRGS